MTGHRNVTGRIPAAMRGLLAPRALAIAEWLNDRTYVGLEYPASAEPGPRYGYGRPRHPGLHALIQCREDAYHASLGVLLRYAEELRQIEHHATQIGDPSWINDMFPGLDGAALYAFLRQSQPRRYIEIGSGNSTMFAARAKRDGALGTELISIDPHPRASIDQLCDCVVRKPLESADLGLFDGVEAGDVIFFDGSHRVFTNSDATVFFLDVLPRLPAGVRVGVHDVYLPDDYPAEIGSRYYSEQYLLASWLLAGERAELLLPAAYVHRTPHLRAVLAPLWKELALEGVADHGAAFWWQVSA
jgi:hypothetical protein